MGDAHKTLIEKFSQSDSDVMLTFNAVVKNLDGGRPEEAVLYALKLGCQYPDLAENLFDYLEERMGFERTNRELFTEMHNAVDLAYKANAPGQTL